MTEQSSSGVSFDVTLTFPLVSKSNEKVSQITLRVDDADNEEEALKQVFSLGAVAIDDDSLDLDENVYYVVNNAIRIHIKQVENA